jgi:hypothetical protein
LGVAPDRSPLCGKARQADGGLLGGLARQTLSALSGGSGIRTHGNREVPRLFKSRAFVRSAIPPDFVAAENRY